MLKLSIAAVKSSRCLKCKFNRYFLQSQFRHWDGVDTFWSLFAFIHRCAPFRLRQFEFYGKTFRKNNNKQSDRFEGRWTWSDSKKSAIVYLCCELCRGKTQFCGFHMKHQQQFIDSKRRADDLQTCIEEDEARCRANVTWRNSCGNFR